MSRDELLDEVADKFNTIDGILEDEKDVHNRHIPDDLRQAVDDGRALLREYRKRLLVTDILQEIGDPSLS